VDLSVEVDHLHLEKKISQTQKIFEQVYARFAPDKIAVAWTGGKDSTTVLWLWKNFLRKKEYGANPKALNVDTGLKFPEIIKFRDHLQANWKIDLIIARPEVTLETYPIAQNKVACCRDLKIIPLQKAVRAHGLTTLLTGLRFDEHPSREKRDYFEQRKDPEYMQVNPILHWREMDIWSYIMQENLPYCFLYEQGYRSLGCKPCTRLPEGEGERSGRDKEKEDQLSVLNSLGYF